MMRSLWILWTYLTRPLIWIMMAAFLGGAIYLFKATENKYENVDIGIISSGSPVRTAEQLERVVHAPVAGGAEIDWGALAAEQLDKIVLPRMGGGARHIGVKEHEFVNERLAAFRLPEDVVAVRTGSWGVDQGVIERLGELSTLKRLGFLVTYGDQPLDLSAVTKLQVLEILDLGIGSKQGVSLAPLQQLPKLNTLALGSHHWVGRQQMADVAKFASLETLYLPDVSEHEPALAALAELQKSTSLKKIHVAIPMDQPERLAAVQAAIPGIPVGSSQYYPSRIYALIFAVWAILITGSLGLHFIAQFSLPVAQLAPGFRSAHQRVAWGVMAAIGGGLVLLVSCYGASPLATFALLGMCTVTGVGDSVMGVSRYGSNAGVRRWMGMVSVVAFFGLLWLAFRSPIIIEEYVMGAYPLLSGVFLLVLAVAVFRVARELNALCRSGIAQGRPLMLSMHDVQRASLEMRQRKRTDEIESTSDGPYARQEQLAKLFGYLALAAFFVWWFAPQPLYGVGAGDYLVLLCVFLSFYGVMLVGMKWWQRMPYLAGMITRPPRRKQQIGNLFRGVGIDMLRLWPFALASVLFLCTGSAIAPDAPVTRTLISTLLVASVAVVCYVTILWSLTIRSVWGVAALATAVYTVVAILAAGLIATEVTLRDELPVVGMVATALICCLLATAAMIGANRYFQRLEWARFV